MKEQKEGQKGKINVRTDKNADKSKGMVIIPHVKGVTEHAQRILKHHEIATALIPHQNIRRFIVNPTEKVECNRKTNCVY